jgi:zinc transport system ATP-binding protein
LINRLQTQHNLASIIVSHDLSFVFRYATKVLCLNRQQVCFGSPSEALSSEVLTKLYGESVGFYDHHHSDHSTHSVQT